MNNIPIYRAEAEIEGLAEKIRAESSIAYAAKLERFEPSDNLRNFVKANLRDAPVVQASKNMLSTANQNDEDLYYNRSILVSTVWNKNDDVFGKEATWAARHTPSHKPTNLNHDEHEIVGHMTDNWVINSEGEIIDDNSPLDDVPDLFHIVTAAVIYKAWQDPVLIERTEKLIAEIEAGTKFVSMECLFSNFDYAIISPTGDYHVVKRDKETAFLTKHLRRFGGKGEYGGCKIGRLLSNITFSAKGYVDQPANPDSIIFSKENEFNFSKASQNNPFKKESGVSILIEREDNANSKENQNMSDDNKQLDKAEARVKELEAKVAELVEERAKAGVEQLTKDVEAKAEEIKALESKVEEAQAKVEELTKANKEISEAKKEIASAKEALEAKLAEVEKAQRVVSRVAELVEAGASKEVAQSKVDKFINLDDEAWASISDTLKEAFAEMWKEGKDKKDKKDKSDKSKANVDVDEEAEDDASSTASDNTLDSADTGDEVTPNPEASEDDEFASAREELRKAVAGRSMFKTDSE